MTVRPQADLTDDRDVRRLLMATTSLPEWNAACSAVARANRHRPAPERAAIGAAVVRTYWRAASGWQGDKVTR